MVAKLWNVFKVMATRSIEVSCDLIPIRLRKVPPKKLLNWLLVESSVHFKPSRPWGMPTMAQIEASSLCNLHCRLCPITAGLGRQAGHMDSELFKRLIDQLKDYLLVIMLWDWGEPLLNPAVYDMIAYASGREIKVITSSNGHVLAKGDHAERLVRSGLAELIVAVDGIDQETYQIYRQGGDLAQVLAGIKKLVAKKQEMGSDLPFINFRFVVMKHNEHQVSELPGFVAPLGVDALTLKTLNPINTRGKLPEEGAGDLVPNDPRFRRFAYGQDGRTPLKVRHNPCKNPWNLLTVHDNGKVVSCNVDYDEVRVLGDLSRQPVRQVWRGEALKGLRRNFARRWQEVPLCADCSYAFAGGDCGRDIMARAQFFNPPPVS